MEEVKKQGVESLFCPYEQALKLKAIGFNELCFNRFYTKPKSKMFGVDEKGRHYPMKNTPKKLYTTGEHFTLNYSTVIAAPLYQQAFRWFREKYSWQHSIEPTKDQHCFELGYNYWIWNHITGEEHHTMPKNRPSGDWEYETYEKAELACLDRLIEIVESKIKNNESNITKN